MQQEIPDLALVREEFNGSPFWQYLGIEVESLTTGRARIRLDLRPQFLNVNEGVHGGVIVSLIDSAMGLTLRSLTTSQHVTESMTTQFLREPKADGILYATGDVVRQGRKLVAMRGEVVDEVDRLIAVAMATFVNIG